MKGLPPALRKKKRYIAFEVYSDVDLDGDRLFKAINDTMLSLFGELKFLGLELKHFDGKRGILKCYREALKDVKFGLNLVNSVDERRVAIRILGVSGTIKSCMRKFLRR
jgi:ribonuclease P/MRP protein subunit POP5